MAEDRPIFRDVTLGDRVTLVMPHRFVVGLGLVRSARAHRPVLATEPRAGRPVAAR